MKLIVSERLMPQQLERLQREHDVLYDPTLAGKPDELVALAEGASGIIVRNMTQVRGGLLDAMPACRVVGRLGVGLDNIDMETCRRRGIEVIPAVGANARSVAEYVITTAMMLRRGAYLGTDAVARGRWPKLAMAQGREIAGATLGIVGFGSIGKVVAGLATGMGMNVIAHDAGAPASDRSDGVERVSLDRLLETSDVVTLHIPSTPSTRNLLDAAALARMKPGAVLINSARGGIVDDMAVVAALRSGHLAGAALDVFEQEPLPDTPAFHDVPNLVLTPHVAGLTQESEWRVSDLVVGKVLDFLRATRA